MKGENERAGEPATSERARARASEPARKREEGGGGLVGSDERLSFVMRQMRLLVPHIDQDRGNYGLKVKALAKLYVEA